MVMHKIGGRIGLALAAVGALLLVFALFVLVFNRNVKESTSHVMRVEIPTAILAVSLLDELDDMNANVLEYILGEPEEKEDFDANYAEFRRYFAELKRIAVTHQKTLNDIDLRIKEFVTVATEDVFSRFSPEDEKWANERVLFLSKEYGQPLEKLLDSLKDAELADAGQTKALDAIIKDDLPGARLYLELVDEAGDMVSGLREYTRGITTAKDEFISDAKTFEEYLAQLRPLEQEPDEIVQLNKVEQLFKKLRAGGLEIFGRYNPDLKRQAIAAIDKVEHELLAPLGDVLEDQLSADAKSDADAALAELARITRRNEVYYAVILGLALLVVSMIIFLVQRTIASPLTELRANMSSLAEDQTTIDIRFQDRRDEIGSMAQAVAVFKDSIIARQAAEREMRTAKERAEQATRAKSEFLANMSHELRTPLNAILGFAQILERDPNVTDLQARYLKIIGNSGVHLLDLINDILEMSKIEAGRTTLDESDFDLHEMLDSLESMFYLRAQENNLELRCERNGNVPQFIRADERKLRQVLINLLSNAVKFTKEGGVNITVGFEVAPGVSEQRGRLRVSIRDTGVGIASDELKALFVPFVQAKSGRDLQEGTGLGLPLSLRFVEMMGGEIRAESTPGEGSQFSFSVNVAVVEGEGVRASRTTSRVVGLAPGQPAYRVLIAEDQPESRHLLATLLGSVGFVTAEVADGRQAVEKWQSWQPDLIWMDNRMPEMNGLDATVLIRSKEAGDKRVVIIALTAGAFEEDRDSLLAAGCDDFVAKPFHTDVIMEKMEAHLGVKFQYEEATQTTRPAVDRGDEVKLVAEDLGELSYEVLSELHQAAAMGDESVLRQLGDKILGGNSELGNAVLGLVNQLRFEAILEATTEAMEKME